MFKKIIFNVRTGNSSLFQPCGLLWLRGLLALFVVCHHATIGSKLAAIGLPLSWFAVTGSFAVYIFFCISGYLIAKILQEKYKGQPGLYLRNRALRILPLYYVAVALSIMVMEQPTMEKVWPALALLLNYHLSGPFPNGTLWSISTEMQFYILAPICLMFIRPVYLIGLGMIAVGLIAKTFYFVSGSLDDALYASLQTNLLFFGIGWLSYCWRDFIPKLNRGTAILIMVLTLFAVWIYHTHSFGAASHLTFYNSWSWAIVSPIILALVSAIALPSLDNPAGYSRSSVVSAFQRIMQFLGITSYAVYVIHPLVFGRLGNSIDNIAVCYLVATLLYIFIEHPFNLLRTNSIRIKKAHPHFT